MNIIYTMHNQLCFVVVFHISQWRDLGTYNNNNNNNNSNNTDGDDINDDDDNNNNKSEGISFSPRYNHNP